MVRKVSLAIVCLLVTLAMLLSDCGSKSKDNFVFMPGGTGTGTAAAPEYDLIYDRTTLQTYHLVFPKASWDYLQADPQRKEYVQATFIWERASGDETYVNVGIRYKGNFTLMANPTLKKSFKVDFDRFISIQDFHGLNKLNLNCNFHDHSMMKETLAYDLFRSAGVMAGRTDHVKVYLTVEGGPFDHEYLGVYTSVEQVNKVFLRDRFGEDAGNLFKASDNPNGCDLQFRGWDRSAYVNDYVLKTNETANDYSDLIDFIFTLNSTPDNEFKTTIESIFEVDRFLTWMAANSLLAYADAYPGIAYNYYFYHNMTTGRWEYMPWDLNSCFGACMLSQDADYMLNSDALMPIYPEIFGSGNRPLVERLLAVPEFLDSYKQKLSDLMAGEFSPATMHAKIDALADHIRADVYADMHKFSSNQDFEDIIIKDIPNDTHPQRMLGLKPYVTRRVTIVQAQLGP